MPETSSLSRFAPPGFRPAHLITTHPWIIILLTIGLASALMAQIPKLAFDASSEGLLAEDDPVRIEFTAFRDQFGRSEPTVLAVRIPERLGDPVFLSRLQALHEDIEAKVPNLHRATSLANIRHTEARGDTLHVGPLLERLPETREEIEAFEHKVRSSELYENYVISADESWTMLFFESEMWATDSNEGALDFGFDSEPTSKRLISDEEDDAMLAVVRSIVADHARPDFEVRMTGGVLVERILSRSLRGDFVKLLLIAMSLIGVALMILYRSMLAPAIVLTVVLLSLLGTIGFMALVGAPVTLGTQILPTMLLAIGVGYSVHIITIFRAERLSNNNRQKSAEAALDHSARPIMLTALTTLAGFASFAPTDLVPAQQIGFFAPVGVALAGLFSLTLLPALLVVIPVKVRGETGFLAIRRTLLNIGLKAIRHPAPVVATLLVVLTVSAFGIAKVRTGHDPSTWLRFEDELMETVDIMRTHFGGSSMIELLIEAHEGNDLRDPEILQRMDAVDAYISELEVGRQKAAKVVGLHDVVKEVNQALTGGDPSAYRVPSDRELVAQELLLFENSGADDLAELVDSAYTVGRISIRSRWIDAYYSMPFVEQVVAEARRQLGPYATVQLGGIESLTKAAFMSVNRSMITSYGIAFLVVTALIVLMVGDLRVGLVSMIPNLAPIAMSMGFMGWMGITLSTFTLLVGSVILGLVVDDTIHVAHGFVRRMRKNPDAELAIRETLGTTEVALVFSSIALVCGFLAYGLGSLWPLLHFGVVAAFGIVSALIADLVVLPVLLVWLFKEEKQPANNIEPDRELTIVDWLTHP